MCLWGCVNPSVRLDPGRVDLERRSQDPELRGWDVRTGLRPKNLCRVRKDGPDPYSESVQDHLSRQGVQ